MTASPLGQLTLWQVAYPPGTWVSHDDGVVLRAAATPPPASGVSIVRLPDVAPSEPRPPKPKRPVKVSPMPVPAAVPPPTPRATKATRAARPKPKPKPSKDVVLERRSQVCVFCGGLRWAHRADAEWRDHGRRADRGEVFDDV